jgi:hypothetical protein
VHYRDKISPSGSHMAHKACSTPSIRSRGGVKHDRGMRVSHNTKTQTSQRHKRLPSKSHPGAKVPRGSSSPPRQNSTVKNFFPRGKLLVTSGVTARSIYAPSPARLGCKCVRSIFMLLHALRALARANATKGELGGKTLFPLIPKVQAVSESMGSI